MFDVLRGHAKISGVALFDETDIFQGFSTACCLRITCYFCEHNIAQAVVMKAYFVEWLTAIDSPYLQGVKDRAG